MTINLAVGSPGDMLWRVTSHAVTRYVQRVLGVELPGDPTVSAEELAHKHCEAAGKTLDEVRTLIMVPGVAAACLSGLTNVFARDFEAVIKPTMGIVVTVTERRARSLFTKKLKFRSKAECRRLMQRQDRADKGKPSEQRRHR